MTTVHSQGSQVYNSPNFGHWIYRNIAFVEFDRLRIKKARPAQCRAGQVYGGAGVTRPAAGEIMLLLNPTIPNRFYRSALKDNGPVEQPYPLRDASGSWHTEDIHRDSSSRANTNATKPRSTYNALERGKPAPSLRPKSSSLGEDGAAP